jgi:GxxExxY protein
LKEFKCSDADERGLRVRKNSADFLKLKYPRQSAFIRVPKFQDEPMNTTVELKHKEITDKILHAFFKVVYPELGYGFLEKVYENALFLALQERGLTVEQQARITVYFHGKAVGEYCCDLLVENAVIVELKAAQQISEEHKAQLLNYLRATPYEVGLVLNFGPKPDFVRKAYDNVRKSITWNHDS